MQPVWHTNSAASSTQRIATEAMNFDEHGMEKVWLESQRSNENKQIKKRKRKSKRENATESLPPFRNLKKKIF